jgi:MbtH protein
MMSADDNREYDVVVNHEEQYSIWLCGRELPAGWTIVPIPDEWLSARGNGDTAAGVHAKQTCLDYIEEIWTDMRPLSLRRAMAEAHKD